MASNADVIGMGILGLCLGFGGGCLLGDYAMGIPHMYKARVQGTSREYIVIERNLGGKSYYEWSPTQGKYTSFEPKTLVTLVEGELEKKVNK